MQPLAEIRHHLSGLWLLVRGDGRGLSAFDISDQGVLRSFQAMLICLPGLLLYAIQMRIAYLQVIVDPGRSHLWFLLQALFAEVLIWGLALVCIAGFGWPIGYRPLLRVLIVMMNWAAIPFVYISHGLLYPLLSLLDGDLTLIWISRLLLIAAVFSGTIYLVWRILHTVVGGAWWKRLTFLLLATLTTFWIAGALETSLGLTIP
ncbi:hypothetical protein [Rhizobium oryzicola]|uniref:Yip1 domain-containing protein n=1 Tax=Rhizobium oryzicola TaxID=1232668 RepID=A0ABT8SQX4_9HYPH|nr:hypothetical protein [Rhizobium oryzicola]MDO1580841.1 hypothetical protein [Rhizobium oryzicola]